MKNYKAMIFDLDGTLLNTIDDLKNAINYAFNHNGIVTDLSIAEVKTFIGKGVNVLIDRACKYVNAPENKKEQIKKTYIEYYALHRDDLTRPFPDVVTSLKGLKQKHVLLGVISNKPDADVQAIVEYYFPGIFDFVFGNHQNVPTKPNPLVFYLLSGEYGFNNKNTLYVGDMDVDIEFAHNCEMDVAIVNYGFGDKAKLIGATYYIDSFNELLRGEDSEKTI